MELTVLGCAGTFPGPRTPCSGYLLEAEGFTLLVDVGNGVLGALQDHGDLRRVDAVVVTHLHADHVVDLVPWTYARYFHPEGRPPRVPVLGPAGTGSRVAALYDGPARSLPQTWDFQHLVTGTRELGPFRLRAERVRHPVETYGLRVEHGQQALAYTSDTDTTPALDRLASGVDLLLSEASLLDGHSSPPGVHLTAREAGELATRAGVGEVVLTHLVAWNDRARSAEQAGATWDGPLELAVPGLRRSLPDGPRR